MLILVHLHISVKCIHNLLMADFMNTQLATNLQEWKVILSYEGEVDEIVAQMNTC